MSGLIRIYHSLKIKAFIHVSAKLVNCKIRATYPEMSMPISRTNQIPAPSTILANAVW